MNKIIYKNYIGLIGYSHKDRCFVGHIAGINDIIGFHADSVSELQSAFEEAVDDYIDTCRIIEQRLSSPFIPVKVDIDDL